MGTPLSRSKQRVSDSGNNSTGTGGNKTSIGWKGFPQVLAFGQSSIAHQSEPVVLQVPGDGIGEILRRGCKWDPAEKQGKADDSDDSSAVRVLRQNHTGRMPV
jgi:hypothetical protein